MPFAKFNGYEYEVPDPDDMTNAEMMEVEQVSGFMAGDIARAIRRRTVPYSVIVAWTWIAMQRAGAKTQLDELLKAPMGSIDWITDEEKEKETPLEEDQDDSETPGPINDETHETIGT
jgi:hypothetical protein